MLIFSLMVTEWGSRGWSQYRSSAANITGLGRILTPWVDLFTQPQRRLMVTEWGSRGWSQYRSSAANITGLGRILTPWVDLFTQPQRRLMVTEWGSRGCSQYRSSAANITGLGRILTPWVDLFTQPQRRLMVTEWGSRGCSQYRSSAANITGLGRILTPWVDLFTQPQRRFIQYSESRFDLYHSDNATYFSSSATKTFHVGSDLPHTILPEIDKRMDRTMGEESRSPTHSLTVRTSKPSGISTCLISDQWRRDKLSLSQCHCQQYGVGLRSKVRTALTDHV